MKLAIIAGGKGTRLGNLVEQIPKPMLAIGGKPLLQHQIELARDAGIKDIFILSGYLADRIYDFVGNGSKFGVRVTHLVEPRPMGTAGSVRLLEHLIDDPFLVFYGDLLINIDIARFENFANKHNAIATLVAHPNDHPYDSDLIEADGDLARRIHSKPHPPGKNYFNLVNAAVYMLRPEIFSFIPGDTATDFGKQIFSDLLANGESLAVYRTSEYVKDMGTTDRLAKVEGDYVSGKATRRNLKNRQKAVFIDRDGTLNRYVDHLNRVEDFELLPGTADALRRLNKSDYLSLVVTNQPMIAKGMLDFEGLASIHKAMETQLGDERVYVDQVFFCPHHPDRGFEGEVPELKIHCDCRKPKTGMIDEAMKHYNIDPAASFMVGDTTTDMQAGENAGLQTVLVHTGVAGKDGKHACNPDFHFPDLNQFTCFLTHDYDEWRATAQRILADISQDERIVLIGGNARSGKSTFAQVLVRVLRDRQRVGKILPLDDFIVPVEQRVEGMNVFDRYPEGTIVLAIETLLDSGKIGYRPYDAASRSLAQVDITRTLGPTELLIVEGVPALGMPGLRELSERTVFVETDRPTYMERFRKFYEGKGLSPNEIDSLLEERTSDEFELIEKTRRFARTVVRNES